LLKVTPNDSAARLRKLVLSAIANWQQKNETARVEDANLYIKTIFVNEGRSLKRMRFNSQGRGNRIQKRSNHVTVEIDSRVNNTNIES
jgi:large subunit ribosomal protein L22